MKKFVLLLFALVAMGLSHVMAYNFSAVAPSGQTLYYNIVDGNAQVTYQNSSSSRYSNLTGALEIPSTVTYQGVTYPVKSIGEDAFRNCSGLTSVTIPNSVTSINREAFRNCSSLMSVIIGDSVTYIGSDVFSFTPLYDHPLNWTDGVLYVSNYLIAAKSSQVPSSYVIADGTKAIAYSAFNGCSGLTSVTIPNSVTSIGESAFNNCSGLTNITIPNSVTSIGRRAFTDCSSLSSVTIGDSVTSIGESAFAGTAFYNSNSNWTNGVLYIGNYLIKVKSSQVPSTYVVPDGTRVIAANAFYGCSGLTSVTIPNSVTSIENYTFYNCSGLTSVTIPNSVTTIGGSAFYGCSGLTSVTIPNSVTSIENYTFYNCSGLTSVTIGSSVTSIKNNAFDRCYSLAEITTEARVAPQLGSNVFYLVSNNIPVNIPCGTQSSYSSRWSYFSNFVENQGFSLEATSDNPVMGSVSVLTQPSCTSPLAEVSAEANPGYQFTHWSNGVTQNPCSLILTKDTVLTAYFAIVIRDTVFVHDTTIVVDSIPYAVHDTTITYVPVHDTMIVNNYIHDTTIVNNYIHDTTIVVDSIPYEVFVHDTTYIDVFIHDTTIVTVHDTIMEQLTYYTMTIVSGNTALGLVAGNGSFPEGTEVEIAAIPVEGNHFVQWNDQSTDNPRRVTVTENATYVATFEPNATQGVADVLLNNYSVSTREGMIVVKDAEGEQLRVFDVTGRLLHQGRIENAEWHVGVKSAGAYFVQVGGGVAQKVILVK